MSISTIVTYGYGSFGSVNKLPTHGFDIGDAAAAPDAPGLEYTLSSNKLHYTIPDNKLQYTVSE